MNSDSQDGQQREDRQKSVNSINEHQESDQQKSVQPTDEHQKSEQQECTKKGIGTADGKNKTKSGLNKLSRKNKLILLAVILCIAAIPIRYGFCMLRNYKKTSSADSLGELVNIDYQDYVGVESGIKEIDFDYYSWEYQKYEDTVFEWGVGKPLAMQHFKEKYLNKDNIYTNDKITLGACVVYHFRTPSGYDPQFHVWVNCEPFEADVPIKEALDREYGRENVNFLKFNLLQEMPS